MSQMMTKGWGGSPKSDFYDKGEEGVSGAGPPLKYDDIISEQPLSSCTSAVSQLYLCCITALFVLYPRCISAVLYEDCILKKLLFCVIIHQYIIPS